MAMDQAETFAWMRNRIYEELEPENARLKAEVERQAARIGEMSSALNELVYVCDTRLLTSEREHIQREFDAARRALSPSEGKKTP